MSQFNRLFDRKAGNARKWADQVLAEKFGLTANAIPMDLADFDFPVAPPIHQAIMTRAAVPDYSYTYIPEAFYETVIAWNARRFGLQLEKTGSNSAMAPCRPSTTWFRHSPNKMKRC